ncbi:MAG: hypothetical protein S4CHLAM2_11420 [Chlamydiales bacterium]|nr:hypothetical protein [Chlamydiales bacterium]
MAASASASSNSSTIGIVLQVHDSNIVHAATAHQKANVDYDRLMDNELVAKVYNYLSTDPVLTPKQIADKLLTNSHKALETCNGGGADQKEFDRLIAVGKKRADDITDFDLPDQTVEKVYGLIRILYPIYRAAEKANADYHSPFSMAVIDDD